MATAEHRKARAAGISLLFVIVLFLIGPMAPGQQDKSHHAIVLIYHHVSEATPASTSVTPAQFEKHLQYLDDNDYVILPLEKISNALSDNRPLPENAVAITFDDAYRSVLDEALPRLEARNWPFTVFVSTEAIDRGQSPYLSWSQLREISGRGGTMANHSLRHDHLVRRRVGESGNAWRRRVRDDIATAQRRLEEEIGDVPRLFAYPYGESDAELEVLVGDLGFVAFGQQSGPAARSAGMQNLPRFPVARAYADLESLADKLRSLPMPVTVVAPKSRVLSGDPVRPMLRIEIPEGPYRRESLVCYVAGQPPAAVSWDGDIASIQSVRPLGAGRSKYNCTMPSTSRNGAYHWYSHLWIKPNFDGSWYAE